MTVEKIRSGMQFIGAEATIQLSQLVLAMPQITANDDRLAAFANGVVGFFLEEAVDPHEGVYVGVPIPYPDVEASVEPIDRVADEPGVVAGCMITAGVDPPLGDERYNPIYAAAQDHDLPMIFHSGGAGLDNFKNRGYSKLIETHTLGFIEGEHVPTHEPRGPGDAREVPRPGRRIPGVRGLLGPDDHEPARRGVLKAALRGTAPRPAAARVRDEFYYGTKPLECSGDQRHLEYTIEMLGGADRLMYASDYPHRGYDRTTTITDRPFLTDEEKQRILADNAAEVFGI